MTKENLIKAIQEDLAKVKKLIRSHQWSRRNSEHNQIWVRMVEKAQGLHEIVNAKHHNYMIKNRGCQPNDPEFYNHIHPIEDLLAFIEDPNANNDYEDVTLDQEFDFKIYTSRWGYDDTYKLKRIENGWSLNHISINGECNKDGVPYLFANLDHDGVSYPVNLSNHIYSLWEAASKEGLNHKQVQAYLDKLSDWVKQCEKTEPKNICEVPNVIL